MKFPHFAFALLLTGASLRAADPAPKPSDYYKITTFDTPKETALEVSSMEFLPNGRIALGTRRGEIWTVSNATDPAASNVRYQCYAQGQHEIMGLAYKDGYLYETNRYEVARTKDEDGDGRADLFETVSDRWGVSGDYHEYAWGSQFDKNGDLWVLLCLTGLLHERNRFPRLGASDQTRRQHRPDMQRHPLSRRHRFRCGWRSLLHG